jgi:predicted tellurium resistance membrane protein TerC
LLGYVAGELIVEDSAIVDWVHVHAPWLGWAAPVVGIALVVGAAKWLEARRRDKAHA